MTSYYFAILSVSSSVRTILSLFTDRNEVSKQICRRGKADSLWGIVLAGAGWGCRVQGSACAERGIAIMPLPVYR